MCGICGIVNVNGVNAVEAATVRQMMNMIVHRGPDDEGLYADQWAALGHRRLSIIDIDAGKQPIANEDETRWIVFNGEIYNYMELRAGLLQQGHVFRTSSDTEVILHLYEQYGYDCLARLRGMFAFAIWDSRSRELFLARDRVGIKPLYYAFSQGHLLFASELKALLVDKSLTRTINEKGIDNFLTHLYCPGPETLIQEVRKLPPGHFLRLQDGRIEVREYWDLSFSVPAQRVSEQRLCEELDALLADTVRGHMISDVPVGVLLSGGVDSTAMLSYAVEATAQPIDAFTVGFSGMGVADERGFARLAAQRYGVRHHQISVSAQEFWNFVPQYVWHMEEPVCEPPAIALHYVTKYAQGHVKVLISGEGGDEAFAGYQNYRNLLWLERLKALGTVSSVLLGLGFGILGQLNRRRRWSRYASFVSQPLARYYYSRTADPNSPFNRLKAQLYSPAFRAISRGWDESEFVKELFQRGASLSPLNQMLYVDTKSWLPDDLLLKADKMTMANSVELRVPLLDHRILEFAARLPEGLKIRALQTKYLLKRAMAARVPREIIRRPKAGFPVPYERWICNDFREDVRAVLLDPRTLSRGYFDPGFIRRFVAHALDRAHMAPELFALVALELWHRQFIDAVPQRVGGW